MKKKNLLVHAAYYVVDGLFEDELTTCAPFSKAYTSSTITTNYFSPLVQKIFFFKFTDALDKSRSGGFSLCTDDENQVDKSRVQDKGAKLCSISSEAERSRKVFSSETGGRSLHRSKKADNEYVITVILIV
jgi:hypothetical protein